MQYKTWADLPLFLTLDEVALVLGVARATVKRLAQKGELPATKISPHCWRVDKEKLRNWCEK